MSQPIYYKATRPTDPATDFHTGKVEYVVGKRVRPLSWEGERALCGPGYLHASDVPAMSLISGSWPCRLFEVTGRVATGFVGDLHIHKGGFRQLTVVREIDAHLALGPNGCYVAGIITRTRQLDYQEIEKLGAARDAALNAALNAARGAAWGAAWNAASAAARDAARDAAWDAALNAAWDAARDAAWGAVRDAAWGAVRDAAWGAVRDAALAWLVCDLISPEQFDLLYGPWAQVIKS